ncbi:MAG: DUF3696 domain-containing protein [Spirochaetales bacterium]|nr:DUF3696 domain-containing protein [Spirochaetales bacterium]
MITSITIDNFKTFKEVDINVTSLNIFAGLNGLGKSSIIQALLLQRQSMIQIGEDLTCNGLKLKGEILNLGYGKDVFHSYSEEEFIRIEIQKDYKESISFKYLYEMESNFLELAPDSPKQKITSKDFALFNNHFQYLGAERIGPRPHFPIDNFQVEKLGSIGFQGEYSIHFLAKYQRENVTLNNVSIAETGDLLSNVEAWMSRISPGIRLQARLYPDLNVARLSFRFETESETTQEFSPVNVGFGYTYVLPVLIAVLAAKKGDLVIIENPESHIHPHGQAQLGEFFALAAKDGVQLFIETHSDHLINGVRVALKKRKISPDDVLLAYMERDLHAKIHESYITIPGIDKDGRIVNYPGGFMDEYAKQLDELLK